MQTSKPIAFCESEYVEIFDKEKLEHCHSLNHDVMDHTRKFSTAYSEKQDKKKPVNQKEKKIIRKIKGKVENYFVESVILDGEPSFLCYDYNENEIVTKKSFVVNHKIISPYEKNQYGYAPYDYTQNEIEDLIRNPPNRDNLLDEIKQQTDKFIVIRNLDKSLILGDNFLSYCQEWISTVHFPYFVGETESGKSAVTHLFKAIAYRPLYSEDIPNADIYNFLGDDEEAVGTIIEDEAQDIGKYKEKIRTYKNSYSKGSKKPRIITTNFSKTQVFYYTFCLKIFAGERVPEDKGFKERLAVVNMIEGTPKANIKMPTKEDKETLSKLRNKLLFWKVINSKDGIQRFDSGLKQRDQELWEYFLSCVYGTKYFEDCKKTVAYYTQQRHNAIWNSLEAKLFKLVTEKLDEKQNLYLENFWYYLLNDQDVLSGSHEKQTFYPHDFGTKITRNSLSELFEGKFNAKRHQTHETDEKNKVHRRTAYVFDKETITVLTKKYNIKNGSSVSSGQGSHGGQVKTTSTTSTTLNKQTKL